MIVVRPIEPDRDADAVAEALVDSAIHHNSLEPERYEVLDPTTVAEDYRRGRQHPAGTPPAERETLVAELDGRLVGVVDVRVAHPSGSHRPLRYGYVAEIAVAAHARRRGVGAELLRAAEAWARERGCTYAVLDYNTRNDDARRAVGLSGADWPIGPWYGRSIAPYGGERRLAARWGHQDADPGRGLYRHGGCDRRRCAHGTRPRGAGRRHRRCH